MVSIPLLKGVSAKESGDFATRYPSNLEPVPITTDLAAGYLRTAMGANFLVSGPGMDRGGIVWNGKHYRVMGSQLVAWDGALTVIGDVGNDGLPVTLDYGFGRLAIASAKALWYYDGTTLSQVTDTDLGPVNDMLWMDGYFITTDGTSIIVTDLADPFNVNPLKYGSAEADPDQITGLGRLGSQLFAFGSATIQPYYDAGTSNFPFQANTGAVVSKGCCGPFAKTKYLQTYAFVGAGRGEGLGVWLLGSGSAQKISTRAIDDLLAAEPNISGITTEARVSRDENRLYVHLTACTLVYLAAATQKVGEAVWYVCNSGILMDKPYRLRNAVLFGNDWICGDTESASLGVLTEETDPGEGEAFFSWSRDGETYSQEVSRPLGKLGDRDKRVMWRPRLRLNNVFLTFKIRGTTGQKHFGEPVGWLMLLGLVSNKGSGAILYDLEMLGLPGRSGLGWASCEARVETLA